MARTKATLGSGARLADYLSASLLARVFPAERVHEALDAHGVNSQRIRRFPAVAGVYYTMALSLYPQAAYEEVCSRSSRRAWHGHGGRSSHRRCPSPASARCAAAWARHRCAI